MKAKIKDVVVTLSATEALELCYVIPRLDSLPDALLELHGVLTSAIQGENE